TGRTFGLSVAGDVGVRNLFGRALSMGVAARYTRDFNAVRFYTTAPSFFGLPITSNVFLSRSREEEGKSATETSGKFVTDKADVPFEQRLRPFNKVEISYRYAFERNHTFDLEPNPDDPIPFDVVANVARLAGTVVVDTRNDLVDTTRGWLHTSDIEYGPSGLG